MTTAGRAAHMLAQKRADVSIAALFVASVALKLLLLPSYTSTDFEVHRNWLALTNALPRHDWYHERTSEWTLDYPPFFAYFEYALSLAAARVDPSMIAISATPIMTPSLLLFQRLSVIASDAVLFYAIYAFCTSWPSVTTTELVFSRYKRFVIMLLTVFDAGLLYVDHIHFQYNGMLLGLLILSATKFRQKKDLQGAFFYAVLLMLKHIYLYVAPLYFVYLLGHHCYAKSSPSASSSPAAVSQASSEDEGSGEDEEETSRRKRSISNTDMHETIQNFYDGKTTFSLFRFLRLGALVVAVFGLAFGSILVSHPDPIAGLKQIFSRLFPVQRGLCHAYWAPNVWALYAFADKLLVLVGIPGATAGVALMSGGLVQEASFAILPSIPPIVCAALTFVTMLPVLYSVWKYPDSSLFMSALVYCMMCSFLFGYHVHEKAILQVILPLGLMAAESVNDMRLYRFASIVSTISLFPLLFTSAEHGTKVLLAITHAVLAYIALDPFIKHSLKTRHIKANAVSMSGFEKLYLFALVATTCLAMAFPLLPRVGTKYPFVPLILFSVSCAVGNLYVWGMALSQHYRKLSAVKSYLHAHKWP
ncbi:Dolichyl pyrophosphate glc1man9glcnac2 alpha-1,3-glucosyltransferase, partial [Globisporangium splendens]